MANHLSYALEWLYTFFHCLSATNDNRRWRPYFCKNVHRLFSIYSMQNWIVSNYEEFIGNNKYFSEVSDVVKIGQYGLNIVWDGNKTISTQTMTFDTASCSWILGRLSFVKFKLFTWGTKFSRISGKKIDDFWRFIAKFFFYFRLEYFWINFVKAMISSQNFGIPPTKEHCELWAKKVFNY